MKRFVVLSGLIIFGLPWVPFAVARDDDRISLTVAPGAVSIAVDSIDSRFYIPVDAGGQEIVVTVTSATSEPNKNDPDTWYIWVRAKTPNIAGPDNIPLAQLSYWTGNKCGGENRLSNQWVKLATHQGTKHDPPARDMVRFRFQTDRNDLFNAGIYNVVVEYNASHDPYSPQL